MVGVEGDQKLGKAGWQLSFSSGFVQQLEKTFTLNFHAIKKKWLLCKLRWGLFR
jgi:hypothetical protein